MAKYSIEHGIYKKDGKDVFALGVSYYPSYHERKVPVPPEGDRIGELNKDIKGMQDFGFNILRCAALGEVKYDENKNVTTSTPLLDVIAEKCEECDIGLMLRLQGYSMNLSGYSDTLMVNHKGEEMDKSIWYDFVRDCFFHEGLTEDNDAGTAALARHFMRYPSVVGWQTYNEPHYPSSGLFDYHPKTIAAYRKWLVEIGYKTEDEARDFNPPRSRRERTGDPTEWIRWRSFSHDAMTNFLCHASDVAKGVSGLETMTCITSGPTDASLSIKGEDFFRIAEGMDALGTTQYYLIRKPEAYKAVMNLSFAESAAALAGVPMWIIEYDAKTNSPCDFFARNTYAALGTGIKGLLYYQWRGDYIFPDSPEGNGFGIINYDGTKTEKYDLAKRIVKFINDRSDLLLSASKHRTGVAILRSFHGATYADSRNNIGLEDKEQRGNMSNSWLEGETAFFTELAKRGVISDFVRAEDLKKNKLGVRVLFIPRLSYLSEEELRMIEEFEKSGGEIVYMNEINTDFCPGTYVTRKIKKTKFTGLLDAADVMLSFNIAPTVYFDRIEEALMLQTLDTDEGYLAVVTNIENVKRPNATPILCVPDDVKVAIYESFDEQGGKKLKVKGGKIQLPEIKDGCFVRLIT